MFFIIIYEILLQKFNIGAPAVILEYCNENKKEPKIQKENYDVNKINEIKIDIESENNLYKIV